MREIIVPFAIAEQVRPRHLDLDDDDVAMRIERHQVGAAAVAQRHFGDRDAIVAKQHARDAATHISRNQRRRNGGQRNHPPV